MDTWKFYDITHREHVIMNPTSEDKLRCLVELLRLPSRSNVIDIGCGKGEFLVRLAKAYQVNGTGVDISPYCIADAKRNHAEQAPQASLNFIESNGATTQVESKTMELASCLGASWIFGGYRPTLNALCNMVVEGGFVVVGEPFWRSEPTAEYLHVAGLRRDEFGSHAENASLGKQIGLDLVHTFVSTSDDFDRYQGLQWYAAEQYASTHSDDPDTVELVARVARQRNAFLRWGRDTLGWAMYMFRRPFSDVGAAKRHT